MSANFSSILHKRTYFFYFTRLILQNTHISLSILHIYSIKHSQTQQYQRSLHTQPPSSPTQPASSRKINPLNPRNKHSETHSIRNPVNRRHWRFGLITSSIQNRHDRLHHQLWSHHTHQHTLAPLFAVPYIAPILEKKRDKVATETWWRRHFFFPIRSEMRREWIFAFSFFV